MIFIIAKLSKIYQLKKNNSYPKSSEVGLIRSLTLHKKNSKTESETENQFNCFAESSEKGDKPFDHVDNSKPLGHIHVSKDCIFTLTKGYIYTLTLQFLLQR